MINKLKIFIYTIILSSISFISVGCIQSNQETSAGAGHQESPKQDESKDQEHDDEDSEDGEEGEDG